MKSPDMTLRFIVDTQLPPSLVNFFRLKGANATHTVHYPLGALTPDDEIIDIAIRENRIIVTKDNDFLNYYFLKGYPPSLLMIRLGNIKNSELFAFLNKQYDRIQSLYAAGNKVLLVQKEFIRIF
jgi:predicted nuclease of predicted toxin-antitoxin system